MTLENLANLAEIIGVIAVVASLVFVGLQIRQSTRQAKSDAADTAHRTFNEWYQTLTPEMASLFIRSIHDFDTYSPEEKYLIYAYMMPMLVNMQEVHSKWLDGSFPQDRWHFWDSFATNAVSPILIRVWQERRLMFSDSFQEYLDGKIAQGKTTPQKGSVWALLGMDNEDGDNMAEPKSPSTGGAKT
jgi:hypothetical protein